MAEIRRIPIPLGHKIESLVDDKAASGLEVWDLRMRIGGELARCGGIAGVYTNRAYRGQGHARLVIEDSLMMMREQGYHLAALFGIPGFYQKFGFTPALVECQAMVAVRHAEAALGLLTTQEMQPSDAPAVAALYNATTASRTGAIARNSEAWTGFRFGVEWNDHVAAFVVRDGEEIVGYAAYNDEPWHYAISEVGYRDSRAFSSLLAEASRRAIQLRQERITFHLPPDDPFIAYLRRYGCELKIVYPCNGGGMVRIINQGELLGLLQPLFSERLQHLSREGGPGFIVWKTELGVDRSRVGQGSIEWVVEVPHPLLAQLLLGYRSVSDALFENDIHVAEEAIPWLEALFPAGYPYIWPADRF